MLTWGVAPAAIVTGECEIRWAEVGGGDSDGFALDAPLGVCIVITHDLVALTARGSIVKQGST